MVFDPRRAVEQVVLSSPANHRKLQADPAPLLARFGAPPPIADLLKIEELESVARTVATLSGEAIAWRRHAVRAGRHVYPQAGAVISLLGQGRASIATLLPAWQAAWVGAVVLLVHPFGDGNGRVSRVCWLLALARLGFDLPAACAVLSRFFAGAGAPAQCAWRALARGDERPFRERWTDCVHAARIAGRGSGTASAALRFGDTSARPASSALSGA